ncbi:MAG: helix-turn-helix domain-containing protein [Chloroflexota bacterium]
MPRRRWPLFPQTQRRAAALGERLRLARLRRRIPLVEMAARVDASRTTLRSLERGELTASLALLVRVLGVLGLEDDLDQLARDDELGRRLQDLSVGRARRTKAKGRGDG